MSQLNPQQQQIVDHLDGPALVIAGAGSGKTRVIIQRAARLMERGVAPSSILLMTFTNKAAEVMSHRLGQNGEGERVMTGTFHSMANRFLRRHAPLLGFQPNFSILDQSDARELVKAAMAETIHRSDPSFPKAAVVQDLISLAFNRQMALPRLVEEEKSWLLDFLDDLLLVEKAYKAKKRANNAMDFDDLLAHWLTLLEEHPGVEPSRRLRYLMVDEYQDTNQVQAGILERLLVGHHNLMVVGDDAQSIYSWRGACLDNILSFNRRYGGVAYRLEQNYRSTPEVLHLANESILFNQARLDKELFAVRPSAEKPRIIHVYDPYEEADWVTARIQELMDQEVPLSRMGVLYRNHAQSAHLQMRLAEKGIAYVVRSGVKFFDQAHVKDLLSFLKVVHNPLDEVAWLRVMKLLPGVGNTTAAKIYRLFQTQGAVRLSPENLDLVKLIPAKAREGWAKMAQAFKEMLVDGVTPSQMVGLAYSLFYRDYLYLEFDNPREREQDLTQMGKLAARHRSLEGFLNKLALVGSTVVKDQEEEEETGETLTLSTIHQAKGLEWLAVFMIGLVEGQFPHAKCLEPSDRLEEERRLFYVGVTRAERYLDITVPMVSMQYGGMEICRPSRFVEEIPAGAAEVIKPEGLKEPGFMPQRIQGFTSDY